MNHACLIFSHSITPRLQYIVDFLSQYYGLSFRLTSDEEKYKSSEHACRINYSYHRLVQGEIFIHAHVLLTESYTRPVKIDCFELNGQKAFFKTEGDLGFDLFAGIFYLITRYEEYLPHHKDNFGRYAHENALAFRENFLHLPLVNIWLESFRKLLSAKNEQFAQPFTGFSFLPTYDIDMAWSFKNKGYKRNAGALLKLLSRGSFRKMVFRLKVLRGKMADPYDAYEWMDEQHQKYLLKPVYFFLVAPEKGHYDKNINVHNPEFVQLVSAIAKKYPVGLHPSWISGDEPHLLQQEKHILEEITGHVVQTSRQHYIRWQLPFTFQKLLAAGITQDYSMGYGSINGFRASITTPYYWYDLKNEQPTILKIHPFCFMDANARYEQKLTPEEALREMMDYYQRIRAVNGTMITIWHNSFLGTDELFSGWKEVYQQFLSSVTS